jgi:hypothetical protein
MKTHYYALRLPSSLLAKARKLTERVARADSDKAEARQLFLECPPVGFGAIRAITDQRRQAALAADPGDERLQRLHRLAHDDPSSCRGCGLG